MRSLIALVLVSVFACGKESHEVAVPVPARMVSGGPGQIVNAANIPCGVRLQFEFVDQQLVRVRTLNDNTIPVKIVLRSQRTGVSLVMCADSGGTGEKSAPGGGSFGQIGDRFAGDVSLQSVPGAHFLCLEGRTDGFDVCSSLTVNLTP